MHYLGYRKLSGERKVYCLCAEKSIRQEESPTETRGNSGRRKRRPSRDEEYIFPEAEAGGRGQAGRTTGARRIVRAGSVAADGNFNFEWEPGRAGVQIYFRKPVMIALVEYILGLKYPVEYDLK